MYVTHSLLDTPSRSRQVLWRYVRPERLAELIKTERLYFRRLTAFNDEFEGTLTRRTREQLADWFQRLNRSDRLAAYRQVNEYERNQSHFYASCWHMNDHESYLMWKAYAPEKGFAIKTTFERLKACCDVFDGVVTGGVVRYVNYERDATETGNDFQHAATKSVQYCDEREFRLLVWGLDPKNQNVQRNGEDGVNVPVDVSMLIERVVFGPGVNDVEIQELLDQKSLISDKSSIKES